MIGVGHILTRPDGRILIGRRIGAAESPTWCLPGGHLEAGETPLAAGLRETAEETGTRVARGRLLAVCVRIAGSGVTFALLSHIDTDHSPQVTEPRAIDQWRWTDPDDLPRPLFPASEAVIRAWQTPESPLPGWELHSIQDDHN